MLVFNALRFAAQDLRFALRAIFEWVLAAIVGAKLRALVCVGLPRPTLRTSASR